MHGNFDLIEGAVDERNERTAKEGKTTRYPASQGDQPVEERRKEKGGKTNLLGLNGSKNIVKLYSVEPNSNIGIQESGKGSPRAEEERRNRDAEETNEREVWYRETETCHKG